MCKLYAVYQPGNLQEKSLILKMLEQPEECQTALAAVEALRKWNLWRRRAASVGIAEPDASILLRGLDRITGAVVRGSGELSFRVSLIRSTLQIDVCPSASTITSFVQHLQAEMEQQARLSSAKPMTDESSALRAMGTMRDNPTTTTPTSPPLSTTTPSPPKPPSNLCRFFASDKGCRRGNSCKYPHTWSLVDKSTRQKKCLNCGAQGHRAKECKAPGGGSAAQKGASKGDSVGASDTGATSTSTPTSESSRRVNFDVTDIQAKVFRVLNELKNVPVFGPVVASLGAWGHDKLFGAPTSRRALLDSGATHPLRHPRDCGEWDQARDVSVQLAGDSRIQMKQTDSGTLLSADDLSQMIVPLGKVITTLGYRLSWSATECQLVGPNDEIIPLVLRNGCPEISEKAAHQLIQQLEEQQLAELDDTTQASMRTIARLKASWWSYLKNYVRTGEKDQAYNAIDKAAFFNYKDNLKEQLVSTESECSVWDLLKRLPVNRRARKRLLKAEAWIVRWDPPTVDRTQDYVKQFSYLGDQVYVNLNNLLAISDFDDVWKVVQWAALHGRVGSVVTRDAPGKPMDQFTAAPHRSKVHYLHALSAAAREVIGGGAVHLFVEDLHKVEKWNDVAGPADNLWPPWTKCKDTREYLDEMGLLDVSVARFPASGQTRIYKLNSEAAWRLHVARNHQPFRRDCSVCVRNSAAGHQHRSTAHPMAYSLSVDVVGPLKGFGRSPDGKFFKYFVIGAFRIPKAEGAEGHGEVRGHPIPPPEEDLDEDQISEDEDEVAGVPEGGGVPESEVDKEKQQWNELMSTFKEPISTTTLYFAVPVNNKKAVTMLPAVQRIVADVKALGYPVTRLHSDRGGEFRGNLVRKWALGQGMWPTTTSGSDSAANGVAESGVRFLMRRARVLLDCAGISKDHWPTAVQYAAAQQRSERLGEIPMMPVAYGTRVYVKTKRYKTGAVEDFGHHWTRGRYAGPSTDIRGGHVIIKDSGTFIQTTHVRVTKDPPPLQEVMPPVIVEPDEAEIDDAEGVSPEPPLPPPALPPPVKRVRTKGPVAAKLESDYPDYEVLYEAPLCDEPFGDCGAEVKYLRTGEIQYVEAVARQLCEGDQFTERDCARILALFAGTCGNLKVPRSPLGTGMIIGAYVHGGSLGITRYGRDLPWVATYFNEYMARKLRRCWPEMEYQWTTLAIQSAEDIPRHKDSHNERNSLNYVMELKTKSLDGLWVENQGDERRVLGGSHPQDHQHQCADGRVYDGCLVDIAKRPAVFDPLVPHAYVKENKAKWFLSAYTPQGASKLSAMDVQYLRSLQFPVGREEGESWEHAGTLETRPVLRATSLPSEALQGGARGVGGDVEVVPAGDCEATLSDWAIYVPEIDEMKTEEEHPTEGKVLLRKLCGSDDPGPELLPLTKALDMFNEEEASREYVADMDKNVSYWSALGLYDGPRVAKLEPEYVEGVEQLIQQAVDAKEPFRNTYNVSPKETKPAIEKWRPAIAKELGVVEKGFKRITVQELRALREQHVVQELPSKLVYTVKPPSFEAEPGGEAAICKRKARIVCCGNYAADDQGELYAGGAAAESLRCALNYTARRRWRAGITDITGAFMLTPLPQGEGEVIYIIRPPMALVQLGLADPEERWQLTHGMYGLRQSPKLWSSFRDGKLKKMIIPGEEKVWALHQGVAEPNMWTVFEVGVSRDREPEGLILVYVDDILMCGPLWLVRALSKAIGSTWKATDLDLLDAGHEIRFLGCEIAVSEDYDAIYIHQRPYIRELLRLHSTPSTDMSPIQAPREMVTFDAFSDECPGTDEEIKMAQRACGELLWLAQRSRPDIAYVVCAMSSLLSKAAPRCLQIAKRLRSYLQKTQGLALALRPCSTEFEVYTDSSFAPEGARSHSGLVAVWLGSPVSWRSSRQPFVCLSTAECELLAATEGLVLARSIEAVISQLTPNLGQLTLRVDNQAAITIARPTSSASWRTRHLRVRAAHIHEQVDSNNLSVTYVAGQYQWADLLTKSFPRQRLEELVSLWGMIDVMVKMSKLAVVRMMVLCMMMQTSRAMPTEPLALDGSLELYALLAVAGMALVGMWEAFWYVWDRCCSGHEDHRPSRRHRRLQETVQREIAARLAALDAAEPTTPLAETASRPQTSSAASSSSAVGRGRAALTRKRTLDVGIQTDPMPAHSGPVEVREVMVPQWHEGPVYVSAHGDHFHTVCSCWGLRNVHKPRKLMFCNLCQNHSGRSIY